MQVIYLSESNLLADGSITGECGVSIVGVGLHLRHAGCTHQPDWNAYICPNEFHAHRGFLMSDPDKTVIYGDKEELRTTYMGYLYRLWDGAVTPVEPDLQEVVREKCLLVDLNYVH